MAQAQPGLAQQGLPADQTYSTNSQRCIGYSETVAFIAIETDMVPKILEQGYQVQRRDAVPCSFTVKEALDNFCKYNRRTDDVTVLEVRGLPESDLDRQAGRILQTHLPPSYLYDGRVLTRQVSDYAQAPCPLCNRPLPRELASERGQVGVYRFISKAFVVTPCPRCIRNGTLAKRQARLDLGERKVLYHATSRQWADVIKQTGKMVRGKDSCIAGSGVYFAESPRETEWKCEVRPPNAERAVLECEVRVGRVKSTGREPGNTTFASLYQDNCDSLRVDRGICQVGNGKGKHSGIEYVVFSWDQVTVLREVPRDPL